MKNLMRIKSILLGSLLSLTLPALSFAADLSGSFTTPTTSSAFNVSSATDITATVGGTFTGRVVLERSLDNGGSWSEVARWLNGPNPSGDTSPARTGIYRFRADPFTSGTATFALNHATKTLFEVKNPSTGRVHFSVTDQGVQAYDTGGTSTYIDVVADKNCVSPKSFGAKGDGVTDDTAAINLTLQKSVSVCLPINTTFLVTAPVQVPTKTRLVGEGRSSTIKGSSVTGGIIQIGDGTTSTDHVIIRDIGIDGSGTQALKINNAQQVTLDGVYADFNTGSFTDGFWFDQMWASSLKRLWTNGATISGADFKVGGAFNANFAEQWYTSNLSTYNFYFQADFGSTLTSRGNMFGTLTAQGGVTGFYMGNGYGANIVNGLYTENVVHPIVLGDKANNKLLTALTINGAQLGGPSNTHAHYSERIALIDVNYARGVTINSPNLDGSFNIKTFAPLTFGGGGTLARGYAIVNPSGAISSVLLINGGSGYTSPTVTAGGTCTGGSITAAGSGAITSITLVTPPTGCGNAPPIPVIYKDALKVVISRPYFNTGNGVNSPVWPWVGRTSDATSSSGISLDGDLAEDPAADLNSQARLEKVDAFSYKHYEFYRNSSGVEQAVAFTPAAFP